ncbi:ribonuclease H-like domain-containing protein, partial [Panaeolus papilionaceus]
DGSAIGGRVGGAAVLYRGEEEWEVRKRYLGKAKHYTVYDAEVIGVDLALETLLQEGCKGLITIGLDNQAVLSAVRHRWVRSAQLTWIRIQRNMNTLLKMSRNTKVRFTWTPGHEGIIGNERADECAKEATRE